MEILTGTFAEKDAVASIRLYPRGKISLNKRALKYLSDGSNVRHIHLAFEKNSLYICKADSETGAALNKRDELHVKAITSRVCKGKPTSMKITDEVKADKGFKWYKLEVV